jgi:xylan 1,4-beta-xylosidase
MQMILVLASTVSVAVAAPWVAEGPVVAPVKPAMERAEIEAGLKSHDKALYIKEGWIRDPYIYLGSDDMFYLTGTTINPDDPREETDPYNPGLGKDSAVGNVVQIWRSKNLIDWDYLGTPYTLKDSWHKQPGNVIWAPEVHWIPEMNRWVLVHCPKGKANLALSAGPEIKGPWTHPMAERLGGKHDPSLFKDADGTWWLLSGNTDVQPLSKDLSKFTAPSSCIRRNKGALSALHVLFPGNGSLPNKKAPRKRDAFFQFQ